VIQLLGWSGLVMAALDPSGGINSAYLVLQVLRYRPRPALECCQLDVLPAKRLAIAV